MPAEREKDSLPIHSSMAREAGAILSFGFIGWAGSAATIGVSIELTSLWNAMVIHAVAVPVIFAPVSALYFKKFGYTGPVLTAAIFTALAAVLDFIAFAVQRNLVMFDSLLGTWLPLTLILLSTSLTGYYLKRRAKWIDGYSLPY